MAGLVRILVTINVVAVCALTQPSVSAAKSRALIRDTEIESTIRAFATPLFIAAGLTPTDVRIYIINDDEINAFVAGGQNLFLNTGLLIRTETPAQLNGVIAHETGHMAGGHLARTSGAVRTASNAALLGIVLGTATAVATGRGDAGVAVFRGTTSAGRLSLLEYSRAQESAADQAGLRFLDATGQTSRGLYEFLEVLSQEEQLTPNRRSPYVNTHPLTQDRISFVRNHLENSVARDASDAPDAIKRHARMVAKLTGFLCPPTMTFKKFPDTDTSIAARYARVIATYKEPDPDRALKELLKLIGEFPDDGYFQELRGQFLFESGRPREARVAYRKALRLLGSAPLVESKLARVELAINTEESNRSALRYLESVVRTNPDSAFVWRQLAIAQGRNGYRSMAALSLAEEALLRNKPGIADQQARRARAKLPRGSPGWLRAIDIESLAKRRKSESKRR
ncbi:MAG: peptidase [Rhodospirillaceae bacterium]|nr:peptidase [Rhodospirillaceae bacterium]